MNALIAWLAQHAQYPKFFWQSREGASMRAAVGAQHTFASLPLLTPGSPCIYGGMRFIPKETQNLGIGQGGSTIFLSCTRDSVREYGPSAGRKKRGKADAVQNQVLSFLGYMPQRKGSVWEDFPDALFWHAKEERVVDGSLLGIQENLPSPAAQRDVPSWTAWQEQCARLPPLMKEKGVDKVVLGRMRSFAFAEEVPFWTAVSQCLGNTKGCTLFALELGPQIGFFGATPEFLFRRQKERLLSEAVAGTRPRGRTPQEDAALGHDLRMQCKDQEEFNYVSTFLAETLSPLCTALKMSPLRIHKTHALQHIYRAFSGDLRTGIPDAALLEALHPTPALGGAPRIPALSLIQQLETFDRGWYGAPIGWASCEAAEFAVAIRSCLLRGRDLHAFAAAGIVRQSDPKAEWEEIEGKLNACTNTFLQSA